MEVIMNVSSIVVKTLPQYIENVVAAVKESPICDYHIHDEKGNIIITIEGEGVGEEIEKLTQIQEWDHILSAEMMYSYTEDELDQERDKLEVQGSQTPQWLNDENATKEDIVYNGDLKKVFPK